ncbi:hypothetical protein Stsp01_03660 [Streptomyces sp. NBRC 13847]|nr:hypothetical protein Stsp01_03660 [Streptomyces sp. NBRC 13847]
MGGPSPGPPALTGTPDSRAEATSPRPVPSHGNPLRPAGPALTTAGRAFFAGVTPGPLSVVARIMKSCVLPG